MVPTVIWQALAPQEPYSAHTLVTEGFIHCTREPDRLVWVANQFYRQIAGEVTILVIDPDAVDAEVRWEQADGHLFPHVYGPINRDAIRMALPFPRDMDGLFLPLDGDALAMNILNMDSKR